MRILVLHKKQVLSALLICCVLAAVIVSAVAGRAVMTSASPRLLPIYSVETQDKKLSLTINCAWDDPKIEELLGVLNTREIKATFFVVGEWCDKYPNLLKMIADQGHEIGNHSNLHPDMTKLSAEKISADLNAASQKIEAITGKKPTLFRAPSGGYNNTVIETAKSIGYTVIQWDVDSIDWKNPPSAKIIERVTSKVKAGSICLFHAGKQNTLDALPEIIKSLKETGYSFVPVGDLLIQGDTVVDAQGRQHAA